MKNLKRVLSLGLASVMLVGMMVVGAGAADFTDGEDITHVEAVNTMGALNIINGKDDGSFDPEGIVTRAEMAKMITVALNGGVDPVLGTQTTPKFTDIGGHWAQKYIEYCANLGIINGRGDGSFDPAGHVTGTEAAKMMLVAMGYDSTVFNFTGLDWDTNVNVEANNATPHKLYEGIMHIDPSKDLTRDNAAQLIFNGVQDHMMTKSPEMTITNGEISWKYSKSSQTILNTKYNAHVYTAVALANEYAGVAGTTKAGEFKVQAFLADDEAIKTTTMTVKGELPLNLLGKSIKIIIADTKTAGVFNTVYGDPMLADINNIYTVSADKTDVDYRDFKAEVESDGINVNSIGKTTTVKDENKKDVTVYGTPVYLNYEYAVDNDGAVEFADLEELQAATANGRIIELIDNDGDSNVDYIMVSNPAIGQVTSYNEKGNGGKGYITVTNRNTVFTTDNALAAEEFKNVIGVEDVAKDDYVSYIQLGKFYFVNKLESVTEVVTKKIGNNTIVVGGETYENSQLVAAYDPDDSGKKTLKAATTVGDETTLYLDASGYVVAAVSEDATTSYVYLTAIESVGDITGVKARAVFTDGSKNVITITSITADKEYTLDSKTNKLTAYVKEKYLGENDSDKGYPFRAKLDAKGDPIEGGDGRLFKYTENDGEYKLTELDEAKDPNASITKITQGRAILGTSNFKADSNTIFLVKNGSAYTPYTGVANVPTMKSGVKAFIALGREDNGDPTDVADIVVVINGSPSVAKSVYVLEEDVRVEWVDGKKICTIPALVDGEYDPALQLSDVGEKDNLKVVPGLYTGDKISLVNGKLSWKEINNTVENPNTQNETKFYANAEYLENLKRGNVKGMVIGSDYADSDAKTGVDVLTLTNDTKYIVIEEIKDKTGLVEKVKVYEGTREDLAFDEAYTEDTENADRYSHNSRIVMVRAGATTSDDGFGSASIIYIVR